MDTLRNHLESLTFGNVEMYMNLTVFPLLSEVDSALEYLTLGEALHHEVARVVEVSTGGSVPELRFENASELPILILDGEELVGAKQNRTVNLTILAPPGKTIVIPVACVEAGRWRHESAEFAMSERHHYSRGRAKKAASVSCSMRSTGRRHADQQEVWADISAKASRMRSPSPTQAMAAIFDRHRTSVESYVRAFKPESSQVGAVFAIGKQVVGFDLFDRSATLAAMLPKLVRSYAIDAIELDSESNKHPGKKRAREFLEHVIEAECESYPALGLGTDLRLFAPDLVGGGLALEDRLVHLAAFAMESSAAGADPHSRGLARMDARRGSYSRRRR
jgi:hypothetical protein